MIRRVLNTVCAAVVFSAFSLTSFSQSYYVVVGSFASEKGDIREFTSYLPGFNPDTTYSIYRDNNLYHMYVLKTDDRDLAIQKTLKLQQQLESRSSDLFGTRESFTTGREIRDQKTFETSIINTSETASSSAEANETAGSGVPKENSVVVPKGKLFRFLVATPEGQFLNDEVHYIDVKRQREIAAFASNRNVDVLRPSKSNPMTVVCGVFGYKEMEKLIDYADPSKTSEAYQDDQGVWIVPYRLERLEKGDVSIMYNLSFFKDAVLMTPGSQKDLDELVSMMTQNPNYIIKVHAHCNKNNSRKIIARGETENFFDVDGASEITGSPKYLTELRGQIVKDYLVKNGIAANRIKIFGWGGTAMLVDENSQHARLNDRIEIEILKD